MKKRTKSKGEKRKMKKLHLRKWVKYLLLFLYLANIVFIVNGLTDGYITIETAKTYIIIILLTLISLLIQKVN